MIEDGADVKIVGTPIAQIFYSKHGYPVKADLEISKTNSKNLDALIIPGCYAPDKLRR